MGGWMDELVQLPYLIFSGDGDDDIGIITE